MPQQPADIGLRLYGEMQSLLVSFATGATPQVPPERQVVEQKDALNAVIHVAAAIDELTQMGSIPTERGKWIVSLLMVLREYVEPLPPGLSEDGSTDLLTADLQEMVNVLRQGSDIASSLIELESTGVVATTSTVAPDQLLSGGDDAHRRQAAAVAGPMLDKLTLALGLLASVLEQIDYNLHEHPFPNDLGSFACFTRTFRDLRAATHLALSGYEGQARALLRDAYESAGLGRLLAHDLELAEKWLRKGHWVPDRVVRASIEGQVLPDGEQSPYQEYYRLASAWAHPTARSTVPLVLDPDGATQPKLLTRFNQGTLEMLLREIVGEAVFACFALKRAMVDEQILLPAWREQLAKLAEEISGQAMPHLHRDQEAEQRDFEAIQANVLSADQLEDYLRDHPNSWDSVRRRTTE